MSTVLARPALVPALAERLAGVASSPVRELLALLDRPEVVSFAGGLPAPELFDLDGVRTAYDTVLWGSSARRALQQILEDGAYDRDGKPAGDAMRSILSDAERLSAVR